LQRESFAENRKKSIERKRALSPTEISILNWFLADPLNRLLQISTSAHLIPAKMAPHVRILLEVTDVIVKQDILVTTVKQV